MNYKPFLSLIKEYDIITIFRHVHPDGDAVGSQLGLKQFIKDNFPNKEVYAIGTETFDRFPILDMVDDDIIDNSLAIILDTSNRERIDDQRYSNAKDSIKLDHHPIVDQFANLNYVDDNKAATCELLTTILMSEEFSEYEISKECATYLYSGLLTDTLSFKTSNTSSITLACASFLASKDISIYDINQHMFSKDYHIYDYCSYLRSKLEFIDGLAICIMHKEDLAKFNMDSKEGRNFANEFGGVNEFKVWCLFTQNDEGLYDGSLRSKREYVINEIASNYHGGGHKNASGVKNLTIEDLKNIKNDLLNVIKITDDK